ncbi:MAG: nucleoside kinase [Bacteroidaceae bacterium]|nr:nucleoside kinase [Bacteroidaceae bacterium]
MSRTLRIQIVNIGKELFLPNGVTLQEVSEQIEGELGFIPIAAKVNNRMEPLSMELYHPKRVEFVRSDSYDGRQVFIPTLVFVISAAFEELFPNGTFKVEHIASGRVFCSCMTGLGVEDSQYADKILYSIIERIDKLREADIPIELVEDETSAVIERFRRNRREDIVLLLQNYHNLYASYYKMGQHIEYAYVPLASSTSCISDYRIEVCDGGFIVSVPMYSYPGLDVSSDIPQKELAVCSESAEWNTRMHAVSVGEINANCQERRGSGWLIKVAESLQERKIAQVAEEIVKSGKRIVLVAGPSSSGKTTFSKRLEVALETIGCEAFPISLDDFFVNREETPLDENGQRDYECLNAIDVELFNRCLSSLLSGEPVDLPTYNFVTGVKEYREQNRGITVPGRTFIIEGLHGLNPGLINGVDSGQVFRIYVSPMTSLALDNHVRITATDGRLMRRITRDSVQRNRTAKDTLESWYKVREGEVKWIYPYRGNADVFFNTALVYEIAVVKPFVEELLREVPQNCPEYAEARRLLNMLSYLVPLSDREVPPTSIIREFVGGSSFRYL